MKKFLTLFSYEFKSFFLLPSSYFTSILFLTIMASIYLFTLQSYCESPQSTPPFSLFIQCFWIPTLFTVPLLTMRSIAEERRLGTLESLLASSASPLQIILSKFAATFLFYSSLWALTFLFPYLTHLAVPHISPSHNILTTPSLFGGSLFLLASNSLFIAIGIFSSSLFKSQLTAAMLSFTLLFLLIVGQQLLQDIYLSSPTPWLKISSHYLHFFQHAEDFTQGIFDSRPLLFYFSSAFSLLAFSSLLLKNPKSF